MDKISSSERNLAKELLEVEPVNGFQQEDDPKFTNYWNGSSLDHVALPVSLTSPDAFSSIIYCSQAMREIIDKIKRARDSSAPILITGETGTGKELIARAVHNVSPRREREFISFNCGGIGPELIESALFGHRRGAFTGATEDRRGIIREAAGGSLHLDEIGELSLAAQPALLRFLQEGEILPVGEARSIKVNVRVIAATNRDLEAEVGENRFRPDLFARLNKLRLRIPHCANAVKTSLYSLTIFFGGTLKK